mgnify:CR=1 FL=1
MGPTALTLDYSQRFKTSARDNEKRKMWTWRALLLSGAVGVSLANILTVIVAYDEVRFPHQMISDYVATKPGAAVANWAWPLFILSHALFEARLFLKGTFETPPSEPPDVRVPRAPTGLSSLGGLSRRLSPA